MMENKDKQVFDELSRICSFWQYLDDQEISELLNHTRIVTYSAGSSINSTESDCSGMMLVRRGELAAYLTSQEGKQVTLYRMFKNDVCVLSASCVVNRVAMEVQIVAETDTEVYLISSEILGRIMAVNLRVENQLLRITVDKFADVMWTMEQIMFYKTDYRLAVLLLDEMALRKSSRISLTHEQMARHIGSAREVVSRILKEFEHRKLINIHRGEVEIINRQGLRDII
jgi:CRP/FNR family transcriptional regulator, anaerobic regulatory protein